MPPIFSANNCDTTNTHNYIHHMYMGFVSKLLIFKLFSVIYKYNIELERILSSSMNINMTYGS